MNKNENRLSAEELKEKIIQFHSSKPAVLDEEEYEALLDHTVLARTQRGEESLEGVKAVLERIAASQSETSILPKEELDLAIEKIDHAITSFQYAAIWHNCKNAMPVGAPQPNPILWFDPSKKNKR